MATGQTNAEIIIGGGCPTLSCNHEQPILMSDEKPQQKSFVRRLTPKECERLQGFPDDWTEIGEWTDSKGKKRQTTDAARYKAIGNSIALPFWYWLMRRISAQYERPATLGSLFDGIAGFPLCWARCNGGTKYILWSSEIEDFCVAVITKHFGDEDKGIEGDLPYEIGGNDGEL